MPPTKPARALIIAIEDYPKAEGLSRKLAGTIQAATDFYTWLTNMRKLDPADIIVCADQQLGERQPDASTTMDDIVEAIASLLKKGRDKTSDFFLFYSGHGFSWRTSAFQKPADILVASNFKTRETSGRCTAQFSELREILRGCLGGKQHFFFIDACRTVLNEGDIQVGSLGLALQIAIQGKPDISTMFSVAEGDAAFTTSGFSTALLDGLKGNGRAKGWDEDKLYVRFDLLRKYLRNRIPGVEGAGEGSGLILELNPPPPADCQVTVIDAQPADKVTVKAKTAGLPAVEFGFEGLSGSHPLIPSVHGYQFRVTCNGQPAHQREPQPGIFPNLIEPCLLKFAKTASEEEDTLESFSFSEPQSEPESRIKLRVAGAPDEVIFLRSLSGTEAFRSTGSLDQRVPAGDYIAQIMRKDGVVSSHPISVKSGETLSTELEPLESSAARRSLQVAKIGAALYRDSADGSSRIIVLIALPSLRPAAIALGNNPEPEWNNLETIDNESLLCFDRTVLPGPHLVSLSISPEPVRTFSTFCLPGRTTLLVFSQDNHHAVVVRQLVLPVAGILDDALEIASRLQSRFQSNRKLEISEGDWLLLDDDPISPILAAHDMLRDGLNDNELHILNHTILARSQRFPTFPDNAILRVLLNEPVPTPTAPPLLRESLMTVPAFNKVLPFPASKLDYDSMWLSWRDALPRMPE